MKPSIYKVLVVDEEPMKNLIVTLLSTPGHHCEMAIDGRDALDKASKIRFDAVISGMVMPGMNGITLTKELVKRSPNLPVMILTGDEDQYSPAAAIAAGAWEFIKKPFSVVEFTIRFHKMMRDREILCRMLAEKNKAVCDLKELTEKMKGRELERENLGERVTLLYPEFQA